MPGSTSLMAPLSAASEMAFTDVSRSDGNLSEDEPDEEAEVEVVTDGGGGLGAARGVDLDDMAKICQWCVQQGAVSGISVTHLRSN